MYDAYSALYTITDVMEHVCLYTNKRDLNGLCMHVAKRVHYNIYEYI